MSFYRSLLQIPDSVFPDRLLSPRKNQGSTRQVLLLVSGLFFLALLPRAIAAWRLESVCNDAHYYIWLADSLAKGDTLTAVSSYLNLNIYPVILMIIHKLGIDWIVGGKIWGVIVSSLVVFPMFGWIREQYNEQIAAVACFLYAVHPEFIEWSAEPIREPTFWLFATCAIYLMWRSVNNLKLSHFFIAGIVLTLAIHTRTEGWLLVPLLLFWTFFRLRLLEVGRGRLLAGSAITLAMIPLFILLMNVTLLRHHYQWELGRYGQFTECYQWATTKLGISDSSTVSINYPPGVDPTRSIHSPPAVIDGPHPVHPLTQIQAAPRSKTELFLQYQEEFSGSMGSFALFFLGIGLLVMFRDIFHRDKCLFLPLMLLLMLGVWIRFSGTGDMSGRFFLLTYLLVVPCGAIGFLFLVSYVSRFFSEKADSLKPIVLGMFLLFITTTGCTDSLSFNHPRRVSEVQFGNWLKDNYGHVSVIVTESRPALRAGYVVGSEASHNANLPNDLWSLIDQKDPEMVIIPTYAEYRKAEQWKTEITKFFADRSMSPVSIEGAPQASHEFLVFVKTGLVLARKRITRNRAVSTN